MKFHKPLLTALATGALLFAGSVIAQDAPVPPPPPTDTMAPPPPVPPPPPAAPEPPAPPSSTGMPATPPPPADMPPTPPPPPTPADTMATPPPPAGDTMAPPAGASSTGQADMNTPSGELEVHSSMPEPPPAGPAPSFEQLSGGGKSISEEQASAYPLLANDFLYADQNRNGKVSKSEYEKWVAQK
jgi:hypothetical protein